MNRNLRIILIVAISLIIGGLYFFLIKTIELDYGTKSKDLLMGIVSLIISVGLFFTFSLKSSKYYTNSVIKKIIIPSLIFVSSVITHISGLI